MIKAIELNGKKVEKIYIDGILWVDFKAENLFLNVIPEFVFLRQENQYEADVLVHSNTDWETQ